MSIHRVLSVVFVLTALTIGAQATLVVEADFRVNEDFGVHVNGGGDAEILGTNATVHTGTAAGAGYIPAIQDGFLRINEVTGPSGLKAPGLAGSGDGEWRDYMGAESFGSGSMVFVFRPLFSGQQLQYGGPGRKTIFSHGFPGGAQSVWLALEHEGNFGPFFMAGSSQYATLPTFNWDSNAWYMIGASWSAGTGSKLRLFLRELSPTSTTWSYAESPGTLTEVPGGFGFSAPISFGRRSDSDTDGTAYSDIALIQLYDEEYFTEAQFNAHYQSFFIPEPATLALLALPAILVLRRRTAG